MHDIINTLFAARDIAHKLHLGARSFSKHLALGDLYQALLDKADELAEVWQGQYGLMDLSIDPTNHFNEKDPVIFIKQLSDWAEATKKTFRPDDSHILNTWDELVSIIYRTKYKLEHLA